MIVAALSIMCLPAVVTTGAGGQAVFEDCSVKLGLKSGNGATAWGDWDNDGWVDMCAAGEFWHNEEGKGFKKTAVMGAGLFGDFDNDGFVDYFSWSQWALLRNLKGAGFEKVAVAGDIGECICRGAACGDFNRDGYIDIYAGGYEDWERGITYPDMILLNRQGRLLEKAWSENRYRARGVTCCDFDADGDVDVYVSNYRLQPNLLWRNDGAGRFSDVAASHNGTATWEGFSGGHSIGAAWGDFDNDGFMDLFAGNFAHDDSRGHQPHSFFLKNSGPAKEYIFENKGQCGVHYQESYASPATGDYDNDGDLDLFLTTVYAIASFGKENHPVLFRNDGGWKFSDATVEAGLAQLPPTYQAAWADFDNDGDIDLATGGMLFVNRGGRGSWLRVRLTGDGKNINRSAIGSRVRIAIGEYAVTRQVEAGTGEGNQNEMTLHFGLGECEGQVNLEISWAGGYTQKVNGVQINRLVTVAFDKSQVLKQ
ncbi:MAG: CRTAC1 family protein [Sedimentisphaerales bacterium]|nr:CRTAC1 family protein [Sedimentisphaerales bacterium]